MPEESISVLLPVHAGVRPPHLEAALDSVLAQDRPPTEVVVVEDGPLTAEHDAVLERFDAGPLRVVRIRLPVNRGAGHANQAGLLAATGTWIAKVDADDISLPHRFRTQADAVARTGADVCGTAMVEFVGQQDQVVSLRTGPASHDAIARRMRWNNPINHPTAFYRRECAVAVGGYPDLRYMQDYDLFARMLRAGAKMTNLAEPLVLFRAGEEMHRRRRSKEFARLEWQLQRRLRGYGLIGPGRMIANLVFRLAFRWLPGPLMRLVHGRLLSRPVRSGSTVTPTEDRP